MRKEDDDEKRGRGKQKETLPPYKPYNRGKRKRQIGRKTETERQRDIEREGEGESE